MENKNKRSGPNFTKPGEILKSRTSTSLLNITKKSAIPGCRNQTLFYSLVSRTNQTEKRYGVALECVRFHAS